MGGSHRCCICHSTRGNNIKLQLHRFPRDENISNLWASKIGIRKIIDESVEGRYNKYRVCSRHFELIMYPHQIPSHRLKRGAVPTMLLEGSPSKKSCTEQSTCIDIQDTEGPSTSFSSAGPSTGSSNSGEKCLASSSTQTSSSLTALTPRKIKYRKQIKQYRKRLQTSIKKTHQRTSLPHMDEEQFLQFINRHFDESIAKFIKAQFYLCKNKKKGGRYTNEFKQFSLTLYFLGPRVYKFLRKTFRLPSKSTLMKCTKKWDMPPGLNNFLFSVVKSKTDLMKDEAKHCVLCFDEMSIKSHLFYNRTQDEIIGFHDTGIYKTFKPATDVLCVMARGIHVNWKQPLGYFFIHNTCKDEELKEIVFRSIQKAQESGLKVYSVITDQGPNFYGLSKQLDITPENPAFIVDDQRVFYMFDSPHLLKSVRNHFFDNLIVTPDGTTDFKYFEEYYKHMKNLRHRNSYKLTDQHVYPNRFEKMKVRLAAQVFSQSVVGGMSLLMSMGKLPEDSAASIELIDKMDKLFDLFNSSPPSELVDKEYTSPFIADAKQIAFLKEMECYFRNIKIHKKTTGQDVTKKTRCFTGWLINISALQGLWEELKDYGKLYTRRLNQDCLENFFGQVRQCGGSNRNPTPVKFRAAFKKLFCQNYFEHAEGANCIDDLDSVLMSLKTENQNEIIFENLFTERNIFTPLTVESTEYTSAEYPLENTLYYISGYLYKKCLCKHNCCRCSDYGNSLSEVNEVTNQTYFIARHYERENPFEGLTMPALNFYEYIKKMDNTLCEEFQNIALSCNVGQKLIEMLGKLDFIPPCEEFPKQYLLALFVRMRIYHLVKFANMELLNAGRSKKKRERVIVLRHL